MYSIVDEIEIISIKLQNAVLIPACKLYGYGGGAEYLQFVIFLKARFGLKEGFMNYLIIVNKSNLIENSYYEDLKFIKTKDVLGNDVEVEKATYNAYLKLKEALKDVGIFVEISSAYRSISQQQEIIDGYTVKYGLEYVKKYVAPIKTSEHHTGLSIDLALIVDGKKCLENEEAFAHEDIYLKTHERLRNFGFILRYPKGKENITGYDYEPWHIRYVGQEAARVIYEKNLTLEEYVAKCDYKE